MKIISASQPIIENVNEYSNANGGMFKNLLDKGKGLVGSGKVKGLADKLGLGGASGATSQTQAITTPIKKPKKGMNKNLKIGLIVGGSVIALGLIGFLIYKSKNKGK
jgi:hypothetical protein